MWVEWCGKISTFDSDIISHERKRAKAIVSSRSLVSFRPDTGHRSVHPSAASDLTIQAQFTDRWVVLKASVIELHLQTLEQPSFSIFLSLTPFALLLSGWTHNSLSCTNGISSKSSGSRNVTECHSSPSESLLLFFFFFKNPTFLTVSSDYTEDHHSFIHYGLRA